MAAKRLVREAKGAGIFSEVKIWDLRALVVSKPEFQIHLDFIKENPRGLGNWIWKPHILQLALAHSKEDEYLIMLDAGCQLNLNETSLLRLDYYFQLVNQSGGLVMELKAGDFGISDLTERAWTKKAVLEDLDPAGEFADTNQIQSGIILIKNTEEIRELVNQWVALCEIDNYRYLRSPTDDSLEDPFFLGHRWEQSILSLLIKRWNIGFIPDETFFAPNWEDGENFPIWAPRNRSGGDSIRRNMRDIFLIAMAKLERENLQRFRLYRKFLMRRTINSATGK